MKSTKRVNGDYEIIANTTTISGNLVVAGTSTSINVVDTNIQDRMIVINSGETGSGVSTGSPPVSGIEVERGSQPNVQIRWNESTTRWELSNDGTTYSAIPTGAASVGGSNTQVQYNSSGSFAGSSAFTFNSGTSTLSIGSIGLSGTTISTVSNNNLTIDPNGTGITVVESGIRLVNLVSDPSNTSGYTHIFGKAVSSAGSGINYTNASGSGELPTDSKARLYGLIF